MEILLVIVAILILGAGAVAAAGGLGAMPEPERDAYAPALPEDRPVRAADLEGLRFDVAARGYDMAQVDALVARLARELDARDARAAEGVPAPAAQAAAPERIDAAGAEPAEGDDAGGSTAERARRTRRTAHAGRPTAAGRGDGDVRERAAAWRGRVTVDTAAEAESWRPDRDAD